MNICNLSIGTADLHFSDIYWFEKYSYYAFDITLENASTLWFNNLMFLNAGFDHYCAEEFLNAVKEYFKLANIVDGSPVSILFSGNQILAIGARGSDLWIDVRNGVYGRTAPLSFAGLGLKIKSLEVY